MSKENNFVGGGTLYVRSLDENDNPIGVYEEFTSLGVSDECFTMIEGFTPYERRAFDESLGISVELDNDFDETQAERFFKELKEKIKLEEEKENEEIWMRLTKNEIYYTNNEHSDFATTYKESWCINFDNLKVKKRIVLHHDKKEELRGHIYQQIKLGAIQLYKANKSGDEEKIEFALDAFRSYLFQLLNEAS